MYRLLFCLLFGFAYTQTTDLDSLISAVFGNSEQQQQSTEAMTTTPISPKQSQVNKVRSCTTKKDERGVCVLYFLCDDKGYVNTNGIGLFDKRVRRRRRQSPQQDDGDQKSLNGSQQKTPGSSPADNIIDEEFEERRPLNFFRRGPCESYLEECCLQSKRLTKPTITTTTPSPKFECGRRQPEGVGFYYTGPASNEAKFAEFPWMVAIVEYGPKDAEEPKDGKLVTYVGGGSLIHPSVALTAAHFAFRKTKLKVRAGCTNLEHNRYENELYPHQDRFVEDIKVHEKYDSNTLIYNIALLFLESPMDMAPNVGVVCLPLQSEPPPYNTRCYASGWGKNAFGKNGVYQKRLKKLDLRIIDHYTCEEQLRQTRLGPFFELDQSFTCAGGESGRDTCRGDGGSPLVCPIAGNEDSRYQQHGIVSWGIGCGENSIPGVYADVGKARTWIDASIRDKGLDPKVYTP